MFSLIYFNRFDPLTGSTDYDFPLCAEAGRWAERARTLFCDLSSEELTEAINLLDWIYSDYNQIDKQFERLASEIDDESNTMQTLFPNHSYYSHEILAIKGAYPLASYTQNHVIKWSHLIALFGINTIAEAYDEDIYQRSQRSNNKRDDLARLDTANFFMFSAIEVIGMAEAEKVHEKYIGEHEENVKSEISLRNQKAAIASHAKSQALKNKFISWYYEKRANAVVHSRAQAAATFYKGLPHNERIFTESNAKRTLLDALRKFEKEKSRD